MYHRVIPSRILTAVGIGLLIFSLVFGWVAFAVPDWLQFHEGNGQRPNDTTAETDTQDFKKFGLWYKCIFSVAANDFVCKLWDKDTPSFVRVAQVLIPIGLALGCLSLVISCVGLICRRVFVTSLLFAALFAFLNFIFITIGITVFANESLVYVDRLRLPNNDNPRRWGMWLLVPSLVLSFITSICFIVGSIMNWCDYRSMQVTGIFSHSGDKFNGSVCKAPSDSNATSGMKQPFQYQDYPNACYQINGMNHPQQNMMGYPPPPTYPGTVNPAFQATPSTLFGYSRPGSPTMYPNTNLDPFHTRQYMTEMSEMEDLPHRGRSRHRSHSQSHSRSRRRSSHRSRSYSSCESASPSGRNPQATQFVPIPVPYYQAQPQPPMAPQPTAVQQTPMTAPTTSAQSMPYVLPQATQQYVDDNSQTALKPANIIKYNVAQPPVLVQNPNQPVYTIAYRANTGNNMLGANILTGPATTTYVTAARNPVADLSSFNSDTDNEERPYQTIAKRKNLKKININETWAWRKMR